MKLQISTQEFQFRLNFKNFNSFSFSVSHFDFKNRNYFTETLQTAYSPSDFSFRRFKCAIKGIEAFGSDCPLPMQINAGRNAQPRSDQFDDKIILEIDCSLLRLVS